MSMESSVAKETTLKTGNMDYAFLDLIHDPAFAADMNKKVIYANEPFAALAVKKREQVIGAQIQFLIKTDESVVDETLATGDKTHVLTWAMIECSRARSLAVTCSMPLSLNSKCSSNNYRQRR